MAREISEALQARDVVRAQAFIAEGERLFGRAAMVDAVELQARHAHQDRMAEHYPAMDAVRDVEEPYHEPSLADRQRENLRQFDDVGEIVRAWRTGNASWDYSAWGPDPDDVGCLVPWDVLREAR